MNPICSRVFLPLWAAGLIVCLGAGCERKQGAVPLPYAALAQRLADVGEMPRLDVPGTTLLDSADPTGGNDDFNHPLRDNGDGWLVLADVPGPGYVSRFWFTGCSNGQHELRFYFDGEQTPRVDTSLDHFCGGATPHVSPVAAYEPWAWYSLAPIPFQKRLVVMTTGFAGTSQKLYHQLGIRTLPKGQTVASYPAQLTTNILSDLAAAGRALAADWPQGQDWQRTNLTVTVPAGATSSAWQISGPAVLHELRLRVDNVSITNAVERNRLLRQLVVRIYWNDQTRPSVEVPLGDLFGSFWQPRQFRSFYFGMTNGEYRLRFPMPFAQSARLALVNESTHSVAVACRADWTPVAWTNAWGYFHANWRKSNTGEIGRPHVFLETAGRGKYVGCILSTFSADQSWWLLEGDELISVDDETQPGWRGTGLEDYFNAGWYYGSAIIRPFHGLIFKAHFRTIQYRVHQTDPVVFSKRIKVQLERGPDNASHGALESVAFYYLEQPAPADTQLPSVPQRVPPIDPASQATLMLELADLERLGDLAGALNRIDTFLAEYPAFPLAEVVRMRRELTAQRLQGRPWSDISMAAFLVSTNTLVLKYAQDWEWFRAAPSNALLGIYADMPCRVFLDGKLLGEGGNPEQMGFVRVTVDPGRHVLAVQAGWRPYPRWVQVCLRTWKGDVNSGPDWKYAIQPRGSWAQPAYDDSAWKTIGGPEKGKGPPEEPYIWQVPHPYLDMQSRARGIWVPDHWEAPNQTVVFRHPFE